MESVRLPHTVDPSGVKEDAASFADTADPHGFVRRLACRKARYVGERISDADDRQVGERLPLVLGCDTAVVVDGMVLGKPRDVSQAAEFLWRLSGRDHWVITGICLFNAADGAIHEASSESVVRFRALRLAEREWYLQTGEWFGAAGGYRVQGQGAFLVERINGSYSNVVGLPLETLYGILMETDYFGISGNAEGGVAWQ